jgi:ribosomal protein S9
VTAPTHELIQTVGRRKQAIVRVRLVPGTGQYTLNGRTLEQYFPNKVHQQAINEPFVTLEKTEQYDVIAACTAAASRARPARCAWRSPGP